MIKRLILLMLGLLSFIIFQSCGSNVEAHDKSKKHKKDSIAAAEKEKKDSILHSRDTKNIEADLNDYYNKVFGDRFNGGMLVAKKGVIIFEKYNGYANFSSKTPIDSNTSFQLASTSKPFTAMAILWLQQQGILNINDNIKKYFPDFPYKGITLKLLMSHRSGLPNYLYFSHNYWKDRTKYMNNMDVVNMMIKYHPHPAYMPDTHFQYCNTNFVLLAAVIEKITGESLGDFLKETFFEPLGMNSTWVYNPEVKPRPGRSQSYDNRGRLISDESFDGVVGDKNVYSTPHDMLKWDQALYTDTLISAASKKLAFTPYSHEHPGIRNYGLGWRMMVYPDGRKVIYHNGWWHGNNSVFYRFIQDSTTLIIMSNRYNRAVYEVKPLEKILGEMDGDEDNGED